MKATLQNSIVVEETNNVYNSESSITEDAPESISSGDENSAEDDLSANAGWADSIAKILKSTKPKGKRNLILSKAKKLSDVKKRKVQQTSEFEVVGGIEEEKTSENDILAQKLGIDEDEDESKSKSVKKKTENLPNLRVKPNILEKEREKLLSKIATRGVVQLFNAVRNQQKDIESRIEQAGPLHRKKEKVMKSLDKNKFLDILMGQSKSENIDKQLTKTELKPEVKEEESSWNVFRDDFMMGAKMKDWDKKDKQTSDEEKLSDLSQSDSE